MADIKKNMGGADAGASARREHHYAGGYVAPADSLFEQAKTATIGDLMDKQPYAVRDTATMMEVADQMIRLKVSSLPVVDEDGRVVGFISDGDIMRYLAKRGDSMLDPAALTMIPTSQDADFSQRLAKLSKLKVSDVATRGIIGVDIHDDLTEVCRVLGENHLKKVPVLEDGRVVGVINRSNITQYSMREYLDHAA